MKFDILTTRRFDRELKKMAKKYNSLKSDYRNLLEMLEKNPLIGTPIGLDCYKIRIAIESKGKGKSGGARIITHVHISDTTVYLLSIYDKSERENLSESDIKEILKNL